MPKESFWGEGVVEAALSFFIGLPMALGILSAPLILFIQTLQWLKTSVWPPMPVSKAFAYFDISPPQTDWLGLQQVFDYLLDSPLSVVLPATTLAAYLILLYLLSSISF